MSDHASTPETATKRRRRPLWVAGIAAAVTFLSVFGLWNRQQADTGAVTSSAVPAGLVIASQGKGTSLTAVGRTAGLDEPCTAWLLDVQAASDAAAYAVTTGRCAVSPGSSETTVGEVVRGADIEFHAFAPLTTAVLPDLVAAPIEEITWASSDPLDLAVLRLGVTYGELADQGVKPIAVAARPDAGTDILVAGVPVADIPADQQFLRATKCAAGQTVDVQEADWLWRDLLASDCPGVVGGSYGSPAFNPAGQAVAMVTTSSIGQSSSPECDEGQPCELRDGQPAFVPDATYLTPTTGLVGCFPRGTFTPGDGCSLEVGTNRTAADA